MRRRLITKIALPALPALLATSVALWASAQVPGLTRTVLARADLSTPNREGVMMRIELAPGAAAGWHIYPGEEMSYQLEGESILHVAGQAPRTIRVGESFVIPAGVVHNAHNPGKAPARLVGVFVVEKGQALAVPVLAPQ